MTIQSEERLGQLIQFQELLVSMDVVDYLRLFKKQRSENNFVIHRKELGEWI